MKKDNMEQLLFDSYLLGIVIGCIITFLTFFLVTFIGGGIRRITKAPSTEIKKSILKWALIIGLIFLIIRILELAFFTISTILKFLGLDLFHIVLIMLFGGALFTTLLIIINKDTPVNKWVGWTGVIFVFAGILAAITFSLSVSNKNAEIIDDVINTV